MTERGKIKFVDRAQQINDFKGLKIGNITPTDIDGFIEYQDKANIFFEVKYRSKELPYGQQLALERLANDSIKSGKKSIVIVVQHDVEDTNLQVDVSTCYVREFFLYKKWRPPKKQITLLDAIHKFIEKIY